MSWYTVSQAPADKAATLPSGEALPPPSGYRADQGLIDAVNVAPSSASPCC
ncbi:MAG: hypothetical protein R3F60_14660 [bacterium]